MAKKKPAVPRQFTPGLKTSTCPNCGGKVYFISPEIAQCHGQCWMFMRPEYAVKPPVGPEVRE